MDPDFMKRFRREFSNSGGDKDFKLRKSIPVVGGINNTKQLKNISNREIKYWLDNVKSEDFKSDNNDFSFDDIKF